MPKNVIKGFIFLLAVLMVSGCAGKSRVTARAYVDDKERVDQNMEDGNFGYLMGTPVPEDRTDIKKTRKIYVLEFTKEPEGGDAEIMERRPAEPPREEPVRVIKREEPAWAKPIVIPRLDDEYVEPVAGVTNFVDYTIANGDTLQKISKKFYGSYSKWTMIYELNKDVIGDPNRIQPGVTIRIPVEGTSENLK